jgi:hypothetical protein
MFNFKQRKLQEERKRQEELIAGQLRALELDHELEYEKLTQRGLIANKEQKIAREKEEERLEKKKLSRNTSKSSSDNSMGVEDAAGEDGALEDAPNGSTTSKEEMGYVEMARMGYQQLVNAIIRPPRCIYEVSSTLLSIPVFLHYL